MIFLRFKRFLKEMDVISILKKAEGSLYLMQKDCQKENLLLGKSLLSLLGCMSYLIGK